LRQKEKKPHRSAISAFDHLPTKRSFDRAWTETDRGHKSRGIIFLSDLRQKRERKQTWFALQFLRQRKRKHMWSSRAYFGNILTKTEKEHMTPLRRDFGSPEKQKR
jgi:hypothetical protein